MLIKLSGLLIFLIVLSGCNWSQPEPDEEIVQEQGEVVEEVGNQFEYQMVADLEDVTEGGDLYGGVNTSGLSSGSAEAGYMDGMYKMRAVFVNLPPAPEGSFYEGWIVRPTPLSVVSTGLLMSKGDDAVNEYESEDDMTDHIRYVLTLEPDDGDPAPAEHVVEGEFESLN